MQRQFLWRGATAMIFGFALLIGGCRSAGEPPTDPPVQTVSTPGPELAPSPDPDPHLNQPKDPPAEPDGPEITVPDLPGDMASLRESLAAETSVGYTIVVADAPREVDKTVYLDQMLEERGYPGKNEVLLVIFPADNYNIRFAMGVWVFDRKISLQSMLKMVQEEYLTRSRQGDPAGGLAALINAINAQVK